MRKQTNSAGVAHALLAACLVGPAAPAWAATVTVELISERGVQGTAAHEWLQLVADAGAVGVRFRTAGPGDQPKIENLGDAEAPTWKLTGLVNSKDELVVPSAKFTRYDRAKLRDYLADLAADGDQAIVAPRGRFGLTEPQFNAVYEDLAQPLGYTTKGRPLAEVLNEAAPRLRLELAIGPAATRELRQAPTVREELHGLTRGTALAIALRGARLGLTPEKLRGAEVRHTVMPLPKDLRAGEADFWPIGWPIEESPRAAAPVLFEFLNVQVDGIPLAKTMASIEPRLKDLRVCWDHATLAAAGIDPATIPVQVPRTRTYYKRLIDKVLFQARLKETLRVDERGAVLMWITR